MLNIKVLSSTSRGGLNAACYPFRAQGVHQSAHSVHCNLTWLSHSKTGHLLRHRYFCHQKSFPSQHTKGACPNYLWKAYCHCDVKFQPLFYTVKVTHYIRIMTTIFIDNTRHIHVCSVLQLSSLHGILGTKVPYFSIIRYRLSLYQWHSQLGAVCT